MEIWSILPWLIAACMSFYTPIATRSIERLATIGNWQPTRTLPVSDNVIFPACNGTSTSACYAAMYEERVHIFDIPEPASTRQEVRATATVTEVVEDYVDFAESPTITLQERLVELKGYVRQLWAYSAHCHHQLDEDWASMLAELLRFGIVIFSLVVIGLAGGAIMDRFESQPCLANATAVHAEVSMRSVTHDVLF